MSNDTLNGTAANDTLNGGSGNTTAYGFGGNDSLSGNGGNDTLFGDGTLSGEASGSAIVGTTGTLTTSNFNQYWGGVSLTALHQDGSASTVAINAKGIGVTGDVNGNAAANGELGYDAVNGTSEKLKVDFNGHSVTQATVGLSFFFSAEQTYREAGAWTAFKDGVQVSTGTFLASSTGGASSITIQPGVSFDSLVFTALPYVNAQGNPVAGNTGDTSEYYIRTIDYCWEPGADTITSGQDTLNGGAGSDKLYGGLDNDLGYGGDSSDTVQGDAGNDAVYGDAGEDKLYGDGTSEANSDGNDSVYGGVGNDTIYGGGGNDLLDGGDGTNTYYGGSGDDTIVGGSGNETIFGGSGNDLISGNGGAGVIDGDDGNDTINGGSTNDTIYGDAGNDSITGNGGSDQMYGGDGNDTLTGTPTGTNDTLDGGAGDDVLNGGGGADQVLGKDGNDTGIFVGGEGAGDVYDGGKGTDTVQIKLTSAQFNNAAIHGDLVNFAQFLTTNSNPASDSGASFTFNSLNLSAKNWEGLEIYVDGVLTPLTDPLFTENGDTVNFNSVAAGSYTAGTQYNALGGNDTVTLANNGAAAAASGFDTAHDFHAGAGNDTVSGGGLNDSVFGDSGSDTLTGGSGSDVLHGDDGSNGTEVTSAVSAVNGLYDVAGASSLHLTIQNMGDVSVGYRNMFGGYAQDANGNPIGGQILFASTFDTTSHTVTLDISNLDNVAKIGFFIIPNGHALNPGITDNADVQFQQVSGKWTAFVNGQPLAGEGQPIFFSNPALNADGAYDHESDNGLPGNSNWEDLAGGGDKDNNDVNMQIDVTKTVGSGGNDSVDGGDGNDSVYGDGGNDTIDGGAGSDAVYGGIGNDAGLYTMGQGGTDVYDGGIGSDTMVISLTAAQFANPAVVSELAQFNLFLQANSNPAISNGPSFVFHTLGDLTVSNWENGLLLVDGQQTALPVLPPLFTVNNDSVDFNNVVAGTYLPGTQYAALDGNDNVVLANSAGAATASGYDAAQAFHANGGNDTVAGGGLNDTVFGDDGNDVLSGGAGNDELFGGDGNDAMYFNADGTWNAGALNAGNGPGLPGSGALISINGQNASSDLFAGGAGIDTLFGTSGNDAIFLEDPYHAPTGTPHISGVEVIDAGAGNDLVDLTSTVYGYGDVIIRGGDGGDTLWSSAGNDSIDGGAGDDSVDGGFGNDSIDGGTGNDTLLGGAGNDTATGGDGNDVLAGGAGNDQLNGGAGNDSAAGGDGDDTVNGDAGNDVLAGDAGNDQLNAGSGDDSATGGDGSDTISGDDGDDTLAGDAGTDSVTGGLGSDSIDGGTGNDTLIGDGVPGNGGGVHVAVTTPNSSIDPNTIAAQWATQGVHVTPLTYNAGTDSYSAASFGSKFDSFNITAANTSNVSLQGNYQYSGLAVSGGLDGGEVDTGDGSSVNGGEVLRVTFDQPMATVTVQLGLLFDGETVQSADHGPYDAGFMEVAQWTAFGVNGEVLTGTVQGTVNGLADIVLNPGFAIAKIELSAVNDGAGANGNNSDFVLRAVSGDTYGAANDTINGGDGDDAIQGNQGDDQLFGDAGNDTIDGGTGNDLIYGDSTVSTPTTFTVGQGVDGTYSLADAQGAELTGEYLGGSAGYNNSYGYYLADAAGHPIGGGVIFANVHATGGTFSIDLNAAQLSGATSIGFFIIPNGGSHNPGLTDGAAVTFQQVSGAWTPFVNGNPLSGEGAAALFANPVLNVDGIDHEVDNGDAGNSNWEDIVGGGDHDFNDVNVQIVVTGSAGGGNDSLLGNDGSDTIHGGGGNDTLDGGADSDTVLGETGDDIGVYHAGQGGTDAYDGGFGTDTIQIHVTGAQYADFAVLQELADYNVFLATNSNPNTDSGPTFTFSTLGLSATDWENGELYVDGVLTAWPVIPPLFTPNDDNVDFNSVVAGTYAPGTQYNGLAGNDHVVLPDNHTEAAEAGYAPGTPFHGGDGNDTVIGGGMNDLIHGDDGNDALFGAGGSDQLFGGDGNDSLYWAIDQLCPTDIAYYTSAADCAPIQLLGVQLGGLGLSFDVYVGGAGIDTVYGTNGDDAIVLDVPALPPSNTQRLQDIEIVDAGDGNDLIDLSSNIWTLGDTTLMGGNGFDTVWASVGDDLVDGGTGNDFLVGNLGDDTVVGGAGDDLIYGGHGNDNLIGDGVPATTTSVTSPIAQTPDGLYAVNGADSVTIALENKGNASAGYHNSYGYYFADASGNPISGVVVWDDQHATVGATYNASFSSAQLAGVAFIGAFIIPDGNSLNGSLGSNTPVTFQLVSGQWTAFVGSTPLAGQGVPVILGDSTHNAAGYDYEHDSGLPGNSNWEDIAGGGDNDYNDVNIQIDLTKTVLVPDSYNDTINGDCGDDTISGEQGSDVLFGGSGTDLEYGGDGWDSLNGDDGNDSLYGGAGGDCVHGDAGDDTMYGDAGNDSIEGGDGNDLAFGGDGNDELYGGGGTDSLYGDAGNDYVAGGVEGDYLYGGTGDDSMYGAEGGDSMEGGDGADTLVGDAGNDSIDGGLGNDGVYGGEGNDSILAGDGDDYVEAGADNDAVYGGAGTDTVYGGDGDDSLNGGDGNDLAYGGNGDDLVFGGGTGADTLFGDAGNDYVAGGTENDSLSGGTGDDSVYGAEGDDNIDGGDGIDTLLGDEGNDTIAGGEGDDGIYGGTGNDSVLAGGGNDYVEGGADSDVIFGGSGNDVGYGGDGWDSLNGDEGNDVLYGGDGGDCVHGDAGDDVLYGDAGNDSIEGGDGNDLAYGGADNDEIYGGGGSDSLYGDDGDDYVAGGTENDLLFGGTGDDSVYGAEGADAIYGGDGSDILLGDAGADWIEGGNGNDQIYSGSDGDVVYGGDGNDYVEGDGGDDTVFGDAGNDTLLSGSGNDVVVGGDGNDSIDGGEGSDLLVGNDGDDTVLGDSGDDYIYGQDGNDVLVGGSGDDTVEAGSGNDSAYGGAGHDLLYGGTGDDSIEGNEGNDRAYGGVGNDTIAGGTGYDLLVGEAGNDLIDGGDDDDLIYGDDTSATIVAAGGGLYALNGAGSAQLDIQYLSSDAGNNNSYGYYLADASGTPIGGEVIWANVKATGDHFTLDLNAAALAGAAFIGTFIIPNGANANPSLVDGQAVTFAQNGGGQWQAFVGATPLGGAGLPAFFSDVSKNADAFDHETDNGVEGNSNWEDIAGGGDNDFNDVNLNITVTTEPAGNDTIFGGEGQDTAFGNAGDDSIDGGNGNDELYGNLGDDTVLGGSGNDIVYGDAGSDVLYGGDGVDVIVGGEGTDIMSGDAGEDYMYGQVGNDVMFGGDGADYMEGGEGADTMEGGAANDFMYGGVGNDEVYGGDGQDTLYGEAGNDLLHGGAAADVLVGAEGDDSLYGNDGDDFLFGQLGDDAQYGGAGNDYIEGGAGSDTVDGGDGDDVLHAGEGDDVLTGGAGNDTLYTDGGNDWVFGGDGADALVGGDGSDSMYGDDGDDQIYALNGSDMVFGGAGSDYIEAGAGNDTIRGGADNGLFHLTVVPGGNILVNGSFEDVVGGPVQGTWAPVENANVAGWDNTNGTSIEIWNTPFNQALATDGTHAAETDWDVQADNYIQTVDAATGVSYTLDFDFSSRQETDGVGNTTDSFEVWWNGSLAGTFDPDSMDWSHASLTLVGAAGNDVLEIREAGSNDTYGALIDNMSLVGPGSQSMTLSGGDTVYGGEGADAFQYSSGDGVDTIQDYNKAEGDHIDLALASGISFQTLIQGNDAFIVFSDVNGVLENQAIRIVGCTDAADLDIHLI